MRVRCSQGLEVESYLGAFYRQPSNPTDVYLPAIDCDKAILANVGEGMMTHLGTGIGCQEWGTVMRGDCVANVAPDLLMLFPSSTLHAPDLLAQIRHVEKLAVGSECYLQAALLYTTVTGQRRIRVHTIALPVSDSIQTLFKNSDLDAQVRVRIWTWYEE